MNTPASAPANPDKRPDKKNLTIAVAGNPNAGKSTLINAIAGSRLSVGNWPGVTVEKKEGMTNGHKILDLPGIYSLSPYSPEEKISRRYILDEQPDLIIDVIDATNLERSLYLSTQLAELTLISKNTGQVKESATKGWIPRIVEAIFNF